MTDGINWRPWEYTTSRGRPQMRWVDDIKKHAGAAWNEQNREEWKRIGEAYAKNAPQKAKMKKKKKT